MTSTIKVSNTLRDHLKVQAARNRLTLSAHPAHLAEADDRAHRLGDLTTAIAGTSGKNAEFYSAETAEWERTELTDMKARPILTSHRA